MAVPTASDLAVFLGIEEDGRCADAVAAAVEWAQDRRSLTDPLYLWDSARVRQGTILYAAVLYQARAMPGAGFAGFEEFGGSTYTSGDARYRAMELVGSDVVVA